MKRGPEKEDRFGSKIFGHGFGLKTGVGGGKYDTKRQRSRTTDELLAEFRMEGVSEFAEGYIS